MVVRCPWRTVLALRSRLKPQSLDIAPLVTRPCQLQHEVSGFVWCHVCSREEQGTWACQDGRCCYLFASRYSLQRPCNAAAMPLQCPCNAPAISGALERNEKEWALSLLWRCLNAQIPIQWYLMQVDSVWPRCSSSSSATLVRRASSSLIWRTAVVLRKRVKKPARSAAKFQQNHCYHRCSLHILRFDMIWHDLTWFDMIWRLFRWHRKLELRFSDSWIEFGHHVPGSLGLQWLEFYWLQGLHHHYGRCGLGVHGGRQAGWNAGLHGWQAEDQGQHDAGPEVAVHFGGC